MYANETRIISIIYYYIQHFPNFEFHYHPIWLAGIISVEYIIVHSRNASHILYGKTTTKIGGQITQFVDEQRVFVCIKLEWRNA